MRFGEIKIEQEIITQQLLTKILKELERDGINHKEWISPLEGKMNELVKENIKIINYKLSSEEAEKI